MIITLVTATIEVEPGWAVGAVTHSDPTVDRDILLDAAERPWVPGSALAGSLRAHLRAARPPADERLMGSPPAHNKAEADRSIASPLWIVGCAFDPGDAADGDTVDALEIAGQTAIHRERGAATEKSLRISRLAASGGCLTVYLRHDAANGQPLSDADLKLISTWRPAIGRDRTKGSGRATLVHLKSGIIDPATSAGARIWLTQDGPELFTAVATRELICSAEDHPWLEARFDITDGLLIGDGLPKLTSPKAARRDQTSAEDGRRPPVARSRQRTGRPLIPGSAWKGIIRSRTEFIIRSRYGEEAACQQQTDCCTCVTCEVFGHQGQRGLLAFRDSYIEQARVEPERTHVGIDRVTGGSRDALLFQTQPVAAGQVVLRIDQLGDVQPWVRATIWHVLRDIHDGLIGVGSRTTRGLGTLRLADPPSSLEPVVIPSLESSAEREVTT